MASFVHGGHRLAYTEHGTGDRVVVLVHGLLFNQKLMTPLARSLGRRGYRAITLDCLGHGESDRPKEMQAYSMSAFGAQIIGLLDQLGVEEAAIGGLSLGANASLEAAVLAPERVKACVIHMPVLDNALLGAAVAFTPALVGLTFGAPVMRAVGRVARAIPTGSVPPVDVLLDVIRQDPKPSASIMQGLFFGRVAPPTELRRTLTMPALVIGHGRDPIHPFSDSDALVREMRGARLVTSTDISELLIRPRRLTREIGSFLDEVWSRSADTGASGPPRVRVA